MAGIDRAKLQQEILDTCFSHGEFWCGLGAPRSRPSAPFAHLTPISLSGFQTSDLAPIYEHVASELGLPVDQAKLAAMKEKNAAKLAELEDKIKDAQENLGETEVRDALHAKADYLSDIGDKEAAVKAYAATEEKTAGSGNKMDLVFHQIRWVGFLSGVDRGMGAAWERQQPVSPAGHACAGLSLQRALHRAHAPSAYARAPHAKPGMHAQRSVSMPEHLGTCPSQLFHACMLCQTAGSSCCTTTGTG